MCLLQSSHTSSTAFFYFCMNTDTPIFAPYFENSPTHGFLHGKSLRKAALMAGQYTDVSESTYLNEAEEVWKAREARRLWGSDSSSCLRFRWSCFILLLHKNLKTAAGNILLLFPTRGLTESESRCWGTCFCGGTFPSSAGLGRHHTAGDTLRALHALRLL